MIRQKTMLMFKAILGVTVLCLIAPSEALDSCLYCDQSGKIYMDYIFGNLTTLPMFSSDKPTLKKMASDMGKIEKDMKIDGLMKDKVMKGAIAYSLCSVTSDDMKNAIIMKLLEICFKSVNKDPDQVFLKDCKAVAEQQKYSSDSEQPKDQTQSDEEPKSSQNAYYPPQYNLPQGNLMPAASPKDQINSSKGNNQKIPFQPDKQNEYKYDDISQQQYRASDASAYSGQQNINWDQSPYNGRPARRRNSYEQRTTNQDYRSVATSSASASSFSSSPFNGPRFPNQQPPAQKKTSVNNYNPQQNYQGNPNAFPNTKRDVFFNKINNPGNTLTPDEWNNRGNSQLYGDDLNSFQKPKSPNPLNIYNSPYFLSRYPGNQNPWRNFQTAAATSAYSNTGKQSNNFNDVPDFKPSPGATPSNNYANRDNKAYSFAIASSSLNNVGSEPESSFYPKNNSPNQQYLSPYTIQSNPNPNYPIRAKKPEPDNNLQNVLSTKDDNTSIYPKNNSPNQQYPSPYTIQSYPNPNYPITAKKPEPDTNLQNLPSTKDDNTSIYPKNNSPNQQYPSPYTIQSNPNPNYPITVKKPEPDTNLQNVPSTKDDNTSKAQAFSETMNGMLCNAPPVKNVLNENTTKSELKPILKYVIFYAMYKCGYPQNIGQKCADDSGNFADGLPQGLPTSIKVKAICEMMKMQFISTNMIGDNPVAQAQCLGNYMKDGFEKLQKSPALPDSQQGNQEITGVPNEQINNNNNKEYIDDNPTLYNKSTQINPNKKNDQSNLDPSNLLPDDDDDDDYYDDDYYDDALDSVLDYDPDDNADTAEQTTKNPQTVIQNQPGNEPIKNNQWGTNQPINQNSYPINRPQAELMNPNSFPQQKNDSQDSNLPLKQPNPDDSQNLDAVKNTPDVNSIAESKDRVNILKKMTIACFKNSNFNYKNYSKGIAMVANMTKIQHPEMPVEEAKTLTLVDALFAVIQMLQSIQKANPDALPKLQMTDMPLPLPQNTTPNYPFKQSVIPNPDYQTEQPSINPQPMTQDKPVNQPDIPLLPPVSPSQNKPIQDKQWGTNQPTNQNKEPIYLNSASQWTAGNQPWQKYENSAPPLNNDFAGSPQLAQPKNQDNPTFQPVNKSPVPMQSITYQDSAIQNKQGRNDYRQNPYFPMKNQANPSYMNPVPRPIFPGVAQNKQQDMFNSNQAQQNVQNKILQFGIPNPPIFPQQPIVPQPPILPQKPILPQQSATPSNGNNFQNIPGDQQQRMIPSNGNNFQNSLVYQQPPMIPPNGINFQNNPGYQQIPYNGNNFPNMPVDQNRFQEERGNVPNDQFDTRYSSNVNMQSVGQSGNQGTNNPQAMRFNVPPNNANNWNSQSRAVSTAGNQGVGGINQAGNYPRNFFR